MKKGKAVLGVLAALAAGAILGVIFAPDKDSEAGRNITKLGENLSDSLNKSIDKKFEELAGAIAERIGSITEQEFVSTKQNGTR